MANFLDLRPGERSAEAESVAVLRNAAPVRLAALTAFAAAIFVAIAQLGGSARSDGPPAFLTRALGASDSQAPLVRHPAPGLELSIEGSSFRIRSKSATVTLETQGAKAGDWHRFENGVSRPTAAGAETILVDGPTLEQFLTIRERQGPRTWRWRIDSTRVPRVGDDGGVAFLDTKLHKLTDVSIAPVSILDAAGKDITPAGVHWNVEQRNGSWWLTLRLDDSKLPLPYVVDPAVTHRNTLTGTQTSGTSVSVTKPTGVQTNDLLVAHVDVTGNVTASLTASGWTAITSGTAANQATQASYYKIAGGSEPASYSFSWTGTQAAVASVSAYYGVKSTSAFDVFSAIASTNNTTTVTANSVTTTANDDLVLGFFASASNSTYTPPGGWNERADVGVAGISGSVADSIKTTAGATGNVSATSTVSARVWGHQAAFKVDNVAPSVTMTNPGTPLTGTISLQTSAASDADSYVAQVQFQRSPAGAGSWTNVGSADTTSPYSVSFDTTTVSDGLYDFRAVATDGAGNTANSATISNDRIDNTAPSSTTTFPASGGSYNTSGWNAGCGTNGFCGTYSDAGSGVQKVEISIRRASGNYWSAGSFSSGSEVWNTTSLSAGNWSYTFAASNFPADDSYTIRVKATDNVSIAETPNSRSFTYDTAAPNTSITANPADPTTSTSASFSFTSTEGGSTFECQLDGGGYSSCTSPKSYAGPLSDGSHTFLVRATDAAGNTDATAASYTWTVDTTAPSSTISFPGSGGSYNTSGWNAGCTTNGFCGTYTDGAGGSGVQKVEISIRQGAGSYWSAGSFSSGSEVWNTTTLAGGNWSYTFPASNFPADGSYTIRVKATDNATNAESPSSRSFTIDRVAPDTSITSNPSNPTSSTNASFSFTATEGGSTFECQLDGGGYSACSSPKSYSSLAEGSHTFLVRATDAAGNMDGSAASYTWTVDSVAPSSTTTFPASAGAYNTSGWNAGCATNGFCGTYSDATSGVQTVEISIRQGAGNYWDAGSFSSASEVWNTASLSGGNWSYAFSAASFPADGSYTIRVRAADNAANVETPASRSFTFDATNPSAVFTFPASGGSYANSAWNAGCATNGFCGTYSDATSGVQTVEISIRQGAGNYWNGSSFGSGSEVFQTASISAGNWSYTFPASSFPADGSYTVHVRAKDNALNTESGPSRTFQMDNVNPSALFTFPASSGNYNNSGWNAGCATNGFCGTYSDATSGVQTVEISIRQGAGNYWNGSSFGSGSEVFQTTSISAGNWSYTFPASSFPADGSYTVHVRAKDNALNTESGPSRSFTIDTAAPNTTIDSNPSNPSGSANATFTFSSSEGSSTFECELDGAGFSSCSTPKSYSGLSEGSHTFKVRATDQAGNTDATPAQLTWTVDTVAPNTTIDSNPSNPSGSANATFTFSSSEGSSTFECELDGAGFSSCSTPKSYSGLSEGSHTFKVRATDQAGNTDATPAQLTWTVDTVAPSSTTTFPGPGAGYNTSGWNAGCATIGFCGTYSDATSGVQKVEISIRQGTGNYWSAGSFSSGSEVWNLTSLSAGDWSFAFAASNFPADGNYTIRVKATDNAANGETPASRSFSYDTASPSSTTTFPASAGIYNTSGWNAGCTTIGFCGTYSDATSGVQTVEISIRQGAGNYWNGSSFGSGSEVWNTTSIAGGNWEYAFPASSFPADGSYTIRVKATDNATNAESPSTRSFTIDTAAPNTTIDSNPSNPSGSANATFTFSSSEGSSTFECELDGAGFSSCSTPKSYSGLSEGSHTFKVRATDQAGNTDATPAQLTWTVDTVAPNTTIDSNPSNPSTSADATFTFSGSEGSSTFECELDGGGFGACTSPKAYTSLSDGSHTFKVRAVDGAGNTDATPAQSTWSIDTVAPSSSVTFPGAGAFYRTSTWNAGCTTSGFCGSYSDATSGVQTVELSIKRVSSGLYWNGSAFSSGSELFFTTSLSAGNWSYAFGAANFPADGDYTVRVKATDNATNAESPSSRTFTFDSTAPTGSLTAPADAAVVSGSSVTVSSNSADAGSGVDLVTFERRPTGGGSWTTIGTDATAPYSVAWDTTSGTADGDYDLRVTTADEAGNSFTSTTRTVTVDNTAPTSATLDALPGAIRNGQALTGSGADAGSGVASLAYYYCAGPPCTPSSLIGSSTTGPSYSVTWSAQPADGDYEVRVRVSDRAGNTLDSTKQTVTIDNTDPTGSLTAPNDGAQVSGTIAVSSDSADSGSGVAGAAFQRRPSGGGSWTTIGTDTSAPYSVSWDTTLLGDGDYDLRVVTTDVTGNVFASSTRTVQVDNHAPTVSITAPGAYVNGAAADPFTVTATSPDSDIASVEFFLCSNQSANCSTGSWNSLGAPDTSSPYTASWDVQGDGNQALRAVITDNASNTGSDIANTTVDRTDPTGSVTTPAGGAFVSGSVAVGSNSADSGTGVASAAFERRPSGGGAWTAIATDTSSPYSVSWDTSALNGDFDLHVVTTDVAGNSHTSAAVTVTVDNTAPSTPVISLSESSAYAFVSGSTVFVNSGQSGSYDVDATSSDAQSGIEKIRFPGPVDDTSSPYGTSYAFGALSGSQTVTAYSNAGLTASDTFTVTPDTTGPAAFSLTAPGTGASVANGQTVSASPVDAGAGVDTVEFRYCAGSSCSFAAGTTIDAPDSSAPYSVTWNGQPADGTYTIVARATDKVGNTTVSAERTITVDNTGPTSVLSVDEGTRPDLQYFDAATDTYYYNPAASGDFTVHDAASDSAGVQSVDFPAIADTGFSGSAKNDTTSPYDSNAYSFTTASASAPATETVVVTDALGNATNDTFDLVRDVTSPAGGSVSYADGYDADGSVVVSTANGTDAAAGVDASSGVLERRTSTFSAGSCAGFSGGWSTVTSPDTVASGLCAQYRYRVSDRVGNEAIYISTDVVKVDTSAPSAPALSLSESSAWAFVSGTTIYLNTAQNGTFGIDATTSDTQSGIEKVSFPAGQDDSSSPYQASYAFGDLSGSQTVTVGNNAGLTASSNFTVTADTASPTGGSVSYPDGYDADGQVTISIANGTDALSGVDASSGVLERRTSTLAANSCAGFSGGWSTVTSPDTVATAACAQYRYRVSDNVGNEAVYTSANVVKVDTTAPSTPVISLSESSAYAFVSGSTVFVNTGQSGSYDVDATSSDAQSGIEKIRFPGPVDDTSSPYGTSYAFGALSGSQTVTAYSNAGLTASDTFTVTPDTTAPSTTDNTGALGSAWRNAPVTVTLSPSDGGAGVAATYYTTDGSTPTTSSAQGTSVDLTSDGVYTVKYFSVDRVGNAEAVQTAGTQIRVDLTNPAVPIVTLSESSAFAHVSGTTIYVKSGETGTFTAQATSSDALSGIDKVRFPGGVDDSVAPYQTIYALDDLTGAQTVTVFDDAGNTSASGFDVTADDVAPTGGSVSYPDGYDADGQITISTANGTDALSGVNAASGVLERRTSTLTDGSCAAFAGGWSAVTSPDTVATDTCAQYRYRVSDHVSNEAVYTSANVAKVDQTAPNTSIGSTPSDPTNATGASFTFSSTETSSTFECELDGGGFSSCSSPESYSSLVDGSHTFKVRATDQAGNTDATPAQFTWTVDTAAPNTSIGSTPSDPTNATGASFTFSSTEGGSTFECELDGGGFSACSSPESYSSLGDGSHTFKVRATDQAGNTDASPAQFTWTVDTAAPDTTIDAFPPDPDSSPSPSFPFSASEGGSTFECELDGGGFSTCSSPKIYSSLGDGSHTFKVRATDQAGNTDASPAQFTWVVNAGAPSVSITAPSGFVNLADADPFTVTATSPDGDVANVELFRCSDVSSNCSTGSWVSLGAPDTTAPYTASWSLPADGNAALRAVATDVGSNTGADVVNVTVDRTRPVSSIDSSPADPTNATGASFSFSASEGGVTFRCHLDGAPFAPCSSPKSYSSLADGSHTFEVEATDAAGNVESTPQSFTWTVDTAAPNTSITANPSDPSSSTSADFSFTSTEGGSTFACELDGGGFGACASPASYTGLADGSHTFKVKATDAAGNADASAAVFTWTIDATAPGGGLTDPGSPLDGTVSLSASPSDTGVGVQQVAFQSSPANAGTWSTISTDTTSPYTASWDTTSITDGLYDLRIVVTDNASNTSASAVIEDRLVDNTDPTATMNDPGANLRGTVTLSSTTGDAGSGVATVAYQRSPAGAGTWTSTPASWNTTGVADGLYDLRVVVTDNAGNSTTSSAVANRRVDNTKPSLSSSVPSDGSKVAAAASLVVSANENLTDIFGSAIDGTPVAGVVVGSTVTFTQVFAAGPHTLSGELEDLAGNRKPIRVHFTVWNATGGDYPYIEKNSFAASAMTVAATNGDGELTVPAGAWSGAPAGDWLVARVDPRPAGAVSTGFQAVGDIYDVTSYWALAGGAVTDFDEPLDLTLTNGTGTTLPAALNGAAWVPVARLSGTTLPGGQQMGFYKDGDTVHLLTREAGTFTLLRDVAAPTKPKGFKGKNVGGRLVLSWKAATDNSGLIDAYLVYAKGSLVATVNAPTLSVDMGVYSTKDSRSFQVATRDAAGNVSAKTPPLVIVPKVAKLALAKAKTALTKRGLKAGKIVYVSSSQAKGTVVSAAKSGLVRRGTAISLKVSRGTASRPADTPQTTYGPPSTTPPPYSPAPGTTPPTTSPPPLTGDPPGPETSASAGEAEAESFNQSEVSSARRTAGLVLLAGLFLGAGAMALRARRRLLAQAPNAENLDGPILFWDERLVRAVGSAFRRVVGFAGR